MFYFIKVRIFRIKELNVRALWFMFFKTVFLTVFENIENIILMFS